MRGRAEVRSTRVIRRGVGVAMLLAQAAVAVAATNGGSTAVDATAVGAALAACRTEPERYARLICYDGIAIPEGAAAGPAPRWQGRNGTETFAFTAGAGDTLVIGHDDVILVGALKDASGKLLENLHLAGRGSFTVPIRETGDYQVSLSATGGWTARLEEKP